VSVSAFPPLGLTHAYPSPTRTIIQREITEDLRAVESVREKGIEIMNTRQSQRYRSDFVFRPGKWTDMSFLDESRRLVHHGRMLKQLEDGHTGITEVYVFVFEDYCTFFDFA